MMSVDTFLQVCSYLCKYIFAYVHIISAVHKEYSLPIVPLYISLYGLWLYDQKYVNIEHHIHVTVDHLIPQKTWLHSSIKPSFFWECFPPDIATISYKSISEHKVSLASLTHYFCSSCQRCISWGQGSVETFPIWTWLRAQGRTQKTDERDSLHWHATRDPTQILHTMTVKNWFISSLFLPLCASSLSVFVILSFAGRLCPPITYRQRTPTLNVRIPYETNWHLHGICSQRNKWSHKICWWDSIPNLYSATFKLLLLHHLIFRIGCQNSVLNLNAFNCPRN